MRRWQRETRGGVGLLFALSSPVVLGFVGAALDYAVASQQRTLAQMAADKAALTTAPQLGVANMTDAAIAQAAQESARAALGPSDRVQEPDAIRAAVVDNRSGLEVTITRTLKPILSQLWGQENVRISVAAKVRFKGTSVPLCALTLDPGATQTFQLTQTARLVANKCQVYANSTSSSSISAIGSSLLESERACSAGGVNGGAANFSPMPTTGCPPFADPLSSRPPPSTGACDASTTNLRINGQVTTLYPGTYCSGISIGRNAVVTFSPGEYVIKGGRLSVGGGATISGDGVGMFFTDGADFTFDAASTVSLTAPVTGPLAGILFYQDRSEPALKTTFQIYSDNAQTLVGTIYLPRGRLWIGSNKPIAQTSAYTVIIAYQLSLSAGPTLYLNTNYGATNVPVPDGIRTSSGATALVR